MRFIRSYITGAHPVTDIRGVKSRFYLSRAVNQFQGGHQSRGTDKRRSDCRKRLSWAGWWNAWRTFAGRSLEAGLGGRGSRDHTTVFMTSLPGPPPPPPALLCLRPAPPPELLGVYDVNNGTSWVWKIARGSVNVLFLSRLLSLSKPLV